MECVFADNQENCMSGCESGWTIYLDHSSISPYVTEFTAGGRREIGAFVGGDEEYEDEDLSMVSDASSGPPHLHDEDRVVVGGRPESAAGGCSYNYAAAAAAVEEAQPRRRGREKRRRSSQDGSSLLDDTASSPFFDFSDKKFTVDRSKEEENVLEYSQGYSSTQFEVRPPYAEQYEFFQSTESADQLQQNQWLEGKRW
ncbi:Unknown protein [Striga hermonthica]|uniref:Uncharacterized protein n=1 Tax=Striga hermonthica TaxID=68872 RepID=A0A9N7MJ77_STRHE|nr:Unknown protein [Striga hermonthica]